MPKLGQSSGCGVLLATFVALLLAAAAAAADDDDDLPPCALQLTFFPPGSEDNNFPTAWGQTAQIAAGNFNSSRMFSVVMPSLSFVPGTRRLGYPTLQVLPMHDLLLLGKRNISKECLGYNTGMSFPGPQTAEELAVTVPPRFRVEYQFNGSGVISAGEYQQPTGMGAIPRIELDQLQTYPDAYYCLKIRVVIISWSGLLQHVAVPARDIEETREVCFYKMDGLPTGQANFSVCGQDFNVTISNVEPHPIPLYPGSDIPLYNPVVHMRSDLNRTKDWSWPDHGARMRFYHWRVLTSRKPYTFVPEPIENEGQGELHEGWWNVKLEVSLLTQFPSLMVPSLLVPLSTYNDTEAPEALKDRLKFYAAEQYPPGTVMGLQYKRTQFRFLEGPSSEYEILPNQEVPFTWEFEGFGHQYCFVNGEQVENAAEHTCMSPINVRVPNRKNHTFTVELQDVCGDNFTVEAAFSTWGYELTKAPPRPSSDFELMNGADGPVVYDGGILELAPVNQGAAALRQGGDSDSSTIRSAGRGNSSGGNQRNGAPGVQQLLTVMLSVVVLLQVV